MPGNSLARILQGESIPEDRSASGESPKPEDAFAHLASTDSSPLAQSQYGTPSNQSATSAPGNSRPAGQGPYQCAHCQKRYSRPEHLARHVQSHTLGKRFSCPVCGKAFARADLMKRHAANHENDNDPAKKRRKTDASPGAARVSHACKACAAARVKCEETKPCTRCRSRNLQCDYTTSEAGSAPALHPFLTPQTHQVGIEERSGASQAHTATPHTQENSLPSTNNTPLKLESDLLLNLPEPQGNRDTHQAEALITPYTTNPAIDVSQQQFSNFLRDVLYEQSLGLGRPDEMQGVSMLNFCDNTNYELTDIDFGILDHWNLDGASGPHTAIQSLTPSTEDSAIDMNQMRRKLVKIWTESPWRWVPGQKDTGYGEHGNLPIAAGKQYTKQYQDSKKNLDRVIADELDQSARDKVLTIMLQTCQNDSMRMRVASSFPCKDVMDTLIHVYLAAHSCSVSGWIHWPSFDLNAQWPEWLAVAAAAGAVSMPVPTFRKFGFAVENAVRLAIPSKFEENNTRTKDIGLVGSLILGQDVALWSGNRRKMEIAECHLPIPVTMLRYRGLFQRSSYPHITIDKSDQGEVLEDKWRRWYEAESWKRLVFHCYLRSSQASMATLTPLTISYAELSLPLPEARELWFAKSAVEWKQQWLLRSAGQTKRPPSLGDLIRDINLLTANYARLDVQYVISIYLHCFWSLIFEWRQLSAVHRSSPFSSTPQTGSSLILNSRHQDICKALQEFQLMTSYWREVFSPQEGVLFHLLMMNLHVSMDDLQLFAGKEGEVQARRVYSVLQQWSESSEARQAIWHAGQMLAQARLFPHGHLKEFYAVSIHHGALALWAYGVVSKASRHQSGQLPQQETVLLDGQATSQTQRFIGFGHGRPAVQSAKGGQPDFLDNPMRCMEVAEEVLYSNFVGKGADEATPLPPIVENLCQLIKQLGGAAWAVGLGS